ncbi:hypothetical protein DCAR_0414918 [Daucus carota subsp. sativus]|uniref:Uncharacterized protein n=1 Tax=Daucus carota subsp. sativus TaxID=79200 RepID=A0A165A3H9_DAUCS|nr:hypothetical protein DCAR_0414918 [Daucus carota subsp. sativus]
MSSYSSASNVHSPDFCGCGMSPVLRTSWTDMNPGRRFWGCSMYMNRRIGCNFHQWQDPPVCGRSRNILPGLLKRIERLECESENRGRNERRMKQWLCALAVIVVLFFWQCISMK